MMLHFGCYRRVGFTLIEIMIVIAIIAILAGIAIPNIREARAEAQYTACLTNCETIGKALEMLMTRHSILEVARMKDGYQDVWCGAVFYYESLHEHQFPRF